MTDENLTYIWVNNWEKFQTYTTRRGKPWAPPWVKLYASLWEKDEFLDLTEQTRLLLVGLFVHFSNTRGTLPKHTRSLSRRLHQRVTEQQLARLNHAGFIDFCSETVREQRWKLFMNGSSLEGERDKDTKGLTVARDATGPGSENGEPHAGQPARRLRPPQADANGSHPAPGQSDHPLGAPVSDELARLKALFDR